MDRIISVVIVAIVAASLLPTVYAQEIVLHEGSSGSQDVVCRIPVPDNREFRFINFKKDNLSCENDEARSFTLIDVPANTILHFYDSPNRRTNDDWVRVVTRQDISRMVVGSFEIDRERPEISIEYSRDNGLNGKVSSLEINPPDPCLNAGRPILGREGDVIFATVDMGPTNCGWTGNVQLVIRQDRPWRSDKTLASTNDRNPNDEREMGVPWDCRVTAFDQMIKIFAEFRANGRKVHQSRREIVNCQS